MFYERIKNVSKLLPHVLFEVCKTNEKKQSYLIWQRKSVFD